MEQQPNANGHGVPTYKFHTFLFLYAQREIYAFPRRYDRMHIGCNLFLNILT
ncbi:MAG: hypothetical protein ACI8XB_002105 [Patiriisocius sp.]|jgi:hypothetical protein